MSERASAKGSCLCGAVTLTAKVAPQFGACHCEMCRRWGGGPLLAVECGADVQIDGEENVAVFDSSQWAERGFCNRCGTHLFYRLKESRQHHVPLGLFGDVASLAFGVQVFIDKKPAYYTFADKTEELTEAQIFQMYAPKS